MMPEDRAAIVAWNCSRRDRGVGREGREPAWCLAVAGGRDPGSSPARSVPAGGPSGCPCRLRGPQGIAHQEEESWGEIP